VARPARRPTRQRDLPDLPHTPRPAGWLTETLAATTATVLAWRTGSWWLLAAWLCVGLPGVVLALVDVAVKRLPDALVAAATLGALALLTAGTLAGASSTPLLRSVFAAAGLTAFYLLWCC
jgi:leader peptidase (prepilin peptidase)/N-methyltransferase